MNDFDIQVVYSGSHTWCLSLYKVMVKSLLHKVMRMDIITSVRCGSEQTYDTTGVGLQRQKKGKFYIFTEDHYWYGLNFTHIVMHVRLIDNWDIVELLGSVSRIMEITYNIGKIEFN